MKNYNNEIMYEIKKYSSQGKLSVFVGAGVSMLSNLPSWKTLVQKMADEIKYSYKVDGSSPCFSTDELLKIPQIYYVEKGNDVYCEKIKKEFQGDYKPNVIHHLIMSLKPHHILTTNYDTLLEQAACMFGRNFSVINADSKVSKAETSSYILKVHGDFSEKFVFREEDYLNYESNYILIDKLMKTIFSTNLVIFIGYGLNDYNIKLILNWVKNVQSDSFVKPIFISTEDKLQDYELRYQEQRGIRVLDWNDFGTDKAYVKRYEVVLKGILSYNDSCNFVDKNAILDFIYNKIVPLKQLTYLRREDFNRIFQGEYLLNDEWQIENKMTDSFDGETYVNYRISYIEDFFENGEDYKKIDAKKYWNIKAFFEKCLINGIKGKKNIIKPVIPEINIEDKTFNSKYDDLYDFCKQDYSDIENNYRKAYYLVQLGEYVLSYFLYTEIIQKAKKDGYWILYYFSQINRFYLYLIIKQMDKHLTGMSGVFAFGKPIKLYGDDFLEKLDIEMGNFVLEEQFNELPYDIKKSYPFLEDFSRKNCFIELYYKLASKKYDIDKSKEKYVHNIGLSEFDKIKYLMLECEKFIRDNMLLFAGFDENKLFVKTVMVTWLEAYQNNINKNKFSDFKFFNSKAKFNLTDIIVISKNFQRDDLDSLIKIVNLKEIPFEETERLEDYLKGKIDFYCKTFLGSLENAKILEWQFYVEELVKLLTISAYFVKNSKCKYDVIEFIIKMNDKRINVSERIRLLYLWIQEMDDETAIKKLEQWILNICEDVLIRKYENNILNFKIGDITSIATMIFELDEKIILSDMSEFIRKQKEKINIFIEGMLKIYYLLDESAKSIIDECYEITDAVQLIHRIETCGLSKDCNEYDIIEKYMDNVLQQNKKIEILKSNDLSLVIRYMFLNSYPISIVEKYKEISDEYDFLFYPEIFDKKAFKMEWLVEYSYKLCQKLAQSEIHKNIILDVLRNVILNDSFIFCDRKDLFNIYRIMVGDIDKEL